MYHGILNVYKEKDFSSFDVVAKLRGILKQKKIGHTGTLDPEAEGVLIVCLGNATKLCEMLTDKDKSYEATLRLGITTDTEDMTGKVLSSQEVNVSKEEVIDAMTSFLGKYEQIPPMYSAIKKDGKKLYELARQGVVIERNPRKVTVLEMTIKEISLPKVVFTVRCSKGTYIRSLCRDIGEKLGCGGCMEKLLRTEVMSLEFGTSFQVEDALKLSEIEEIVKGESSEAEGSSETGECSETAKYSETGEYAGTEKYIETEKTLEDYIISIQDMFPNLTKAYVNDVGDKLLKNGNPLMDRHFTNMQEVCKMKIEGTQILVYDKNHVLLGIYKHHADKDIWKPFKMFLCQRQVV